MQFLAAIALLAASVAAGPIEARQGRGAVLSIYELSVRTANLPSLVGKPIGLFANRVGVWDGNTEKLKISSVSNSNQGMTLNVRGGIIEHALALNGTAAEGTRRLIDVAEPTSRGTTSSPYDYEGFSLTSVAQEAGTESVDAGRVYDLRWSGEGNWEALSSPEANGFDIQWNAQKSGSFGITINMPLTISAKLIAQS